MSKAYKCDRCGKLFEFHNDFQTSSECFFITKTPFSPGDYLDLCPKCNKELHEWIKNYEYVIKFAMVRDKEDME